MKELFVVAKTNDREESFICHYWLLNHGFKFQRSVSNGCHDLMMLCPNINDIAIITGADCYCIIYKIIKSEATHILETSVHSKKHSKKKKRINK